MTHGSSVRNWGQMMTTRDATTGAWKAVLLVRWIGACFLLVLSSLLMGCATTQQHSNSAFADYLTESDGMIAVDVEKKHKTHDHDDSSASLSEQSPSGQSVDPIRPPSLGTSGKMADSGTVSYVVKGKRYFVKDDASGHIEKGTASWYGKRFHGRRTSSGEVYDMNAMTAAHKNLPIPSIIEVTNLDNGRSAVVRVNDRGPFHGNRVLDLSYAAATKLDMVDKGMAKVRIQVLNQPSLKSDRGLEQMFLAASAKAGTESKTDSESTTNRKDLHAADVPANKLADSVRNPSGTKGDSTRTTALYLKVGAFGNRSYAEELRQKLVTRLEEGVLIRTDLSDDTMPYEIHVGPVDSQYEAENLTRKLASLGVGQPKVVVR